MYIYIHTHTFIYSSGLCICVFSDLPTAYTHIRAAGYYFLCGSIHNTITTVIIYHSRAETE